MQAELDAEQTDPPIQVLGLNDVAYSSGNDAITTGRTLPWLQPAAGEDDIWVQWNVTYRDVIVLDPQNNRVFTFNLTVNNLADPADYANLKSQLLDAARAFAP